MAPRHRTSLAQTSRPRARWHRAAAVVRAHALSVAPADVARSASLVSVESFTSALERYSRRPGSPFDGVTWSVSFHTDSADSNAVILDLLERDAVSGITSVDIVFGVDSTPSVPAGSAVVVYNGPDAVALAVLVDLIDDVLVDDGVRSTLAVTAAGTDLLARTLRAVDEFGDGPGAPRMRTATPGDSIAIGVRMADLDSLIQSFGQVGVGDVVAGIASAAWRRSARPALVPDTAPRPLSDVAIEDIEVVHVAEREFVRVGSSRVLGTFGPHERVRSAAVSLTLSTTPAVQDRSAVLVVYIEVHPSAGITAPEFAAEMQNSLAELQATAGQGFTRLDDRGLAAVGHVA